MKYLNICLSIFLLVLFVSCSSSTGVDSIDYDWLENEADDSELTNRQKETTQHNAEILAFRDLYSQDSTFIDIPEQAIEMYYNVLVTILTSEAGKEQEIIQELRVFDYRNLHGLIAQPNNQAPFVDAWEDSIITTGISKIDNILVDKGFEISGVYDWFQNDIPTFGLDTETPVNTVQIAQLLEKTGYFAYAEINSMVGDGSDIKFQKSNTNYEVTFIHAYGDCPSGCINNDEYKFTIHKNGEVEYLGKS